MLYTRFLSWAQSLYVVGLVLGLLFIIPSAWFPLQLGKITIVALCLTLSGVLFVLSGGTKVLLRGHNPKFIGLVALLPIAYIVSYFFSTDRSVGVMGYALEADTVAFVLLGFLVYLLGTSLFRNTWSTRVLLMGIAGAAGVAALFQSMLVIFGTSLLPAVFSDNSVNLIGKWNDLGVLVGLLLLLLMVAFEFGTVGAHRRVLFGIVAAFAIVLLVVIHFPLIWTLLLGFSIVMALWSFIQNRPSNFHGYLRNIPLVPVGGIVISGILLVWGTLFNTGLTGIFPVSSLEVRPSLSSSLEVIKAAHGSSFKYFAVGTGPQTFGQAWLSYKPTSVNQSAFWNLDFTVGFSSFVTVLGSVGLLGALAWLIPLILAFSVLVYAVRSAVFTANEKALSVLLSSGAIYLWGTTLFYVPSQTLILIAFAFTGAAVGFAFNRQQEASTEYTPSRMFHGGMMVTSMVLVLLLGWTAQAATKRYFAEAHSSQGIIELRSGKYEAALAFAEKSQKIEKTGSNLRLSVDAGLVHLQQLAQTNTTPTSQQLKDFALRAQETVPQGQLAIELNPKDYRNYISLGRVYDFLHTLGVAGSYESTKQMYQKGAALNPKSPQLPLLMARLEAVKGNLPGVQAALQEALTLKPDYTDAILFVVQLNVAQKDIPSAIIAAQAAVRSAPGVPSIWFELGLLYYASGDTANATPVFEEAIKRQADYANAKYFLGLSYAAQKKISEAIQQFVDLEKSNPDNQEVKLVLSNLRAGKPPFTDAKPPVTNSPEDRTTAPISQ